MPEELKQLLAGLAAAVSNGDAEVKTFSEAEAKKDPDVMGALGGLAKMAEMARHAALVRAIAEHIQDDVIEKAALYVKKENLPKEEMIDFVILGAVSETVRAMEALMSDDDDDDDDDSEDEEISDHDKEMLEKLAKGTAMLNGMADGDGKKSARDELAAILAKKVG
jgi:hypothetical protein